MYRTCKHLLDKLDIFEIIYIFTYIYMLNNLDKLDKFNFIQSNIRNYNLNSKHMCFSGHK